MGKGSSIGVRLELRGGKQRPRLFVGLATLVSALIILLLVPIAASATALPSTIKENMTLTAAGNPYTGNPTIESGVTVKVEPGVKLTHSSEMTVNGTLKVEGTAEKPVVFAGAKEEKSGEWCVIRLRPGSSASVIDHAEVKNAGGCNTGAIWVDGSSPTIKNSTISQSWSYGIYAPSGGGPEIANNRFVGTSYAVYYEASGTQSGEINIHDNNIEKGNSNGIYAKITGTGTVVGKTPADSPKSTTALRSRLTPGTRSTS